MNETLSLLTIIYLAGMLRTNNYLIELLQRKLGIFQQGKIQSLKGRFHNDIFMVGWPTQQDG